MIIAIDGPAASGKGTLGKRIAEYYGFAHLDTGKLYRAVARDTLAAGGDPSDEKAALEAAQALDPRSFDDAELRTPQIGEAASLVARHPQVRETLRAYQRKFARQEPGAVLDGRDIGTIICPEAQVKLFVTASAEERARRRYLELQENGQRITEDEVLADIRARDERDQNRAVAPLKMAEDAVLLDTTNLAIDAAFRAAIEVIEAAMGHAGQAG